MNKYIDTHCHIHFADYELDPDQVLRDAVNSGVTKMICVGCTLEDSRAGIEFAQSHDGVWASIGIHPHEAKDYVGNSTALQSFRSLAAKPKVVAVGEIGLDYYYNHSDKVAQAKLLRFQLDVAVEHALPIIFHVRDAFEDFWKIFDEYQGIRGVVHSFTATTTELEQILERGLLVGLNGIMTFTKDSAQLAAAKAAPLEKIVVETDAPFLTPKPYRGTICQPKHVVQTAEFLSDLRGESPEHFARQTTLNAEALFSI